MIRRQDIAHEYFQYQEEITKAMHDVLQSGVYVLGENVSNFEREFSNFLGIQQTVGLASGFDALYVAMKVGGVGPGDEVIVPAFTAYPTIAAVIQVGATPVFVDVDPDTMLIDSSKIYDAISPLTKCVIPVNLFGNVFDFRSLQGLEDQKILLIEDAAQSVGAKINDVHAGTQGDFGCFSFYPSKNLGAFGDAGAVCVKHHDKAEFLKAYRFFGYDPAARLAVIEGGINSRLDEIQAAVLRIKLKHIVHATNKRKEIAHKYISSIQSSDVGFQKVADGVSHCWHIFNIVLPNERVRDHLSSALSEADIQTNIYYKPSQHQQTIFRDVDMKVLPNSEYLSKNILALPMCLSLTEQQQEIVISTINKFMRRA